mgnify:CR=1 FL=1
MKMTETKPSEEKIIWTSKKIKFQLEQFQKDNFQTAYETFEEEKWLPLKYHERLMQISYKLGVQETKVVLIEDIEKIIDELKGSIGVKPKLIARLNPFAVGAMFVWFLFVIYDYLMGDITSSLGTVVLSAFASIVLSAMVTTIIYYGLTFDVERKFG